MKNNEISNLIKKAQEKEIATSIQEIVKPIKQSKSAQLKEKIFSFHIREDILKELKMISIKQDKSLKELINEAIVTHFKIM